jgi:hypothetical protein
MMEAQRSPYEALDTSAMPVRAVLEMVDLPQPAPFSFLFREGPELGGGPSVC